MLLAEENPKTAQNKKNRVENYNCCKDQINNKPRTQGQQHWLMDLNGETPTCGRRSIYVPAIGKLPRCLRLLFFLRDGIITNDRAPLSYHPLILLRVLFVGTTNSIHTLIYGDRLSLTLSGIVCSGSYSLLASALLNMIWHTDHTRSSGKSNKYISKSR